MGGFFDQLIGKRPRVPDVTKVDLGEQQQKAIEENIAAAPGAAKLAQLSQDQIRTMMEQAIPGFEGILGKTSGNINDLLAGKIPTDVSDAVQRSSAGRALASGYGGTGMARDLVARDLGLTSLDLTQQGLKSAESWIASMEQLYSPSEAIFTGMFVTPQQQYAVSRSEADLQFQRQWLANQIEALPAPWAADLKHFVYSAMSAYSGTAVQPNPYAGGVFGNPGGGGGTGTSSGSGIPWSASDWRWGGGSNQNTGQFPGETNAAAGNKNANFDPNWGDLGG